MSNRILMTARWAEAFLFRGLVSVIRLAGAAVGLFFMYDLMLLPVAWLTRLEPAGFLRYVYLVSLATLLIAVIVYASSSPGREHQRRSGTPAGLDQTTGHLRWVGVYFFPLVLASWAVLLAMPLFADFTMLLYERGVVDLVTTDVAEPVSRSRLVDFYLWQFLEFIPVVHIPETLKWPTPVTYTGGLVGLLVLLFQVGVAVPILLLFRYYRRVIRRGEGE